MSNSQPPLYLPIEVNLSAEAMRAAETISAVQLPFWKLRTVCCEFLSFSLRYPDAELAEVIQSGEWAEVGRNIAEELGMSLPLGWGEQLEKSDLSSLRIEATRLMVGSPRPLCSPYEGAWRSVDENGSTLAYVNPYSKAVERFVRKCGFGRGKGVNEPFDHVAIELELMQHLSSIVSGITEIGSLGIAQDEFPGNGAAQAYAAFFVDHAIAWLPCFAQRLEDLSSLAYYRFVGQFLRLFIDYEQSQICNAAIHS